MARKTKVSPTEKLWGYSYIHHETPSTITYKGRPWLELDATLPSQLRKVRSVLRVLNGSKVKP